MRGTMCHCVILYLAWCHATDVVPSIPFVKRIEPTARGRGHKNLGVPVRENPPPGDPRVLLRGGPHASVKTGQQNSNESGAGVRAGHLRGTVFRAHTGRDLHGSEAVQRAVRRVGGPEVVGFRHGDFVRGFGDGRRADSEARNALLHGAGVVFGGRHPFLRERSVELGWVVGEWLFLVPHGGGRAIGGRASGDEPCSPLISGWRGCWHHGHRRTSDHA